MVMNLNEKVGKSTEENKETIKKLIKKLQDGVNPDEVRKEFKTFLEIIESFKNNTLDKAEFWLEMEGRKIYIRYFPMRDSKGEYQGVLEVTQEITKIRELEGEKRLL